LTDIRLALSTAFCGGFAIAIAGTATWAEAQHRLEISLETSPNHIRNIGIIEYAEELTKRAGGKLEVKVFHGAAKYKDTDVPKALNQGALDMGVPVTLHLGKYISDFDAPDLPIFYGRTSKEVHKVWDGPAGKFVEQKLEQKLGVKIIGRWCDLGSGQTYFINKPVKSYTDMANLKIRTPGGAANAARYEVLGANPVKIAWPDVPQALQRGTVDGLFTTFESVRSAKLWDSGIKHAYVNNQTFIQYVPMVNNKAWASYPKEIQDLIVNVWEEKIDAWRARAEERQVSARVDAEKNGILVVDAGKEDLDASRAKLMAKQDDLIKELKIDPEVVKLIAAALTGS
jgi:C4-dicarboxylate-binding protein DctP